MSNPSIYSTSSQQLSATPQHLRQHSISTTPPLHLRNTP
ncbi:hypothetical protein E2C01_075334 [Portunus trituberculatus]|uniref:Uncharacterized protein n=1 Tax=Portunus trituberculatus TaxID=210409 RepID=A0A5B7IFL1_PORTR|nr:hypothetical protein [Portunus trituberculatus]